MRRLDGFISLATMARLSMVDYDLNAIPRPSDLRLRKGVGAGVVLGMFAGVAYLVARGVLPNLSEGALTSGQPSVLAQSVVASLLLVGVAIFSMWLVLRLADFPIKVSVDTDRLSVQYASGKSRGIGWDSPRLNLRVLDAQDPSLVNPGIYLYNLGWPTRLTREAAEGIVAAARSQQLRVDGPREGGLKGSTEFLIRGPKGIP